LSEEYVGKNAVKPRNGLFAALDVGTTKVACFVARIDDGRPRVIGIGHQIARGMRGGAIIDMDQVVNSVLSAVSAAEQMAGDTLHEVLIGVSGCGLQSRAVGVELAVAGHEITDADMRRVLGQGRVAPQQADRTCLHAIPVGFSIDGSRGIRDPRGMCGERLGVNMHLIGANSAALRNLETVVGRCHLRAAEFVAGPYAAGLACLVEDEMDLGATVIDMGGGTTSIAAFVEGKPVFLDSIPVGGAHVTNDIARGLSTPVAQAERMKTLYGSATVTRADEREIIDVPLIGEEEHARANHVPKSILNGIIQPRLEETFELVRSRLEAGGVARAVGRRAVLTGGACQLQGVRELAGVVLDKQTRIGRPAQMAGLADATAGPAFSACAGLLDFAVEQSAEALRPAGAPETKTNGWFGRVGLWFRENL
jgi:cell division protein FtsA